MDENNKHRKGFEETDIDVISVGKFGVGLLLVTILFMGLLVFVFNFFRAQAGGEAVSIEPVKVFPLPRLEEKPISELKNVRAAEAQSLTSYGWVDQQKGTVRIPIAQAMEMLVQKGLPVRAAAPTVGEGVSMPTESGLGPKMQQPGGPLGEGK
jgi:hypothetical protein